MRHRRATIARLPSHRRNGWVAPSDLHNSRLARRFVTVHGLRVTVVQKRISLEAAPERFRPQEGLWEAPPLNETLPVLSPEWKRSSTCRRCRGPSPRTFPAPGRTGIRAGCSGLCHCREHHWHRPNQCSSTWLRSRVSNIGYIRSAGEDDGDERYPSSE
jgi:hypothetical protein